MYCCIKKKNWEPKHLFLTSPTLTASLQAKKRTVILFDLASHVNPSKPLIILMWFPIEMVVKRQIIAYVQRAELVVDTYTITVFFQHARFSADK